MIDLHLHLDGSLEPEFMLTLAKQQNLNLSLEKIKERAICKNDCSSLTEYLKCFELPLSLLQTEDALMQATFHVMERLDRQNICYAEIRFAPQLHMRRGLSIDGAISAVVQAMNEANRVLRVKGQVILCCMRGGNENKLQNIATIELGRNYLGHGVCAVDLAGDEAKYKTKDFSYLFELCKGIDMPFTIHAGESDGVDSVKSAIEFGCTRIGHGIALKNSEFLIRTVAQKHIGIEMCPSSNLQTKAIKSLEEFPVREFLDYGILATINTDNMTVSNTTIDNEFEVLKNGIGLTGEEKKKLICNAIRVSFLNESDKTKLLLKVLTGLNEKNI